MSLLCAEEKKNIPFYIEVLGIHIYSSQELCYVIYHHPLLVMNDFVDASLFFFVKNELGLGFLAGRMEKLVEAGGHGRGFVPVLSECDYYTEKNTEFRKAGNGFLQKPFSKCLWKGSGRLSFFPETVWKSTAEV